MLQFQAKRVKMPFEGNPHKGTIVLLPYRADTWRDNASYALNTFFDLVSIIAKYERVYLVCDKNIDEKTIKRFSVDNVEIIKLDYNDSWARDNTLIYVQDENGQNIAVDFRFNAWGGLVDGLYRNWEDDDKLGMNLINYFNDSYVHVDDFILEGGSIHTDGEGTFITTEACLLSPGRNQMSKHEIEQRLKAYLGAKKIIWLPHGIYNDETNEHVDNMACFLAKGVVALAVTKDCNDKQYEYSMLAKNILENETDAEGNRLKIIEIETPIDLVSTKEEANGLELSDGILRLEGNRLAGSYINFYMSDKFVIVPKFNHPLDDNAYKLLKDFYKEKDVYQLESREILLGGGNIHCVTMQIPKEILK